MALAPIQDDVIPARDAGIQMKKNRSQCRGTGMTGEGNAGMAGERNTGMTVEDLIPYIN
ncbi:hypothetical protein [Wolbachia endosymbiont (group B) of Ablattaria laevigata]|uniref:hypothetical protein n=1 Tax=Wolbachia endosymbiont (group B) of Ablattaria laevigata TaxID=3077915 RepID=UPI00376EE47C